MTKPRILLCTPFCNEEHSISQYVESLVSIDYPKELIDIVWVEDDSSDNTWHLLNKWYEKLKKDYKYRSINLYRKPSGYGNLPKETFGKYKVGKVDYSKVSVKRAIFRAHHLAYILNFMCSRITKKHDFVLVYMADAVVSPNIIKRFLRAMKNYSDCGWIGGVIHRRYPCHIRKQNGDPLGTGLESPHLKVLLEEVKNKKWVHVREEYPYGIVGATEEDISERRQIGDGIFEVCCTGHVWMMRRIIAKKVKFKISPMEAGLQFEVDMNKLGYKMYCDSRVYLKHISVDGKIYRHGLDKPSKKIKKVKKKVDKLKRRKVRPLLAIMSPRNIPWVRKEINEIDYVDKAWFKYTTTKVTLRNIEKYFHEHKEYTHLIIHADDGAPDYDHVAMLVADVKKYDFQVITGCCCVDKLKEDMFLNLTFNPIVKDRDKLGVKRCNYRNLPYEFRELNGIIRVWFQGNALAMVRRDVIEKIGLGTWIDRFGSDIRFSYECWKHGIRQYSDLRVYMDHYKYYQSIPPFNLLVGKKSPEIVVVKATTSIPKAEPAKMVRTIPEKYMKLMNYYYGDARTIKICLVTEFNQQDYFQWFMALKKFSYPRYRYGGAVVITKEKRGHRVSLSSVVMNPTTLSLYPTDNEYWNPIREAELVFVYCARHNTKWEWYKLPVLVKEFMNPKSKMICQFDHEFMWLWHPNHVIWNVPVPWTEEKTPEQFFKQSDVLKVADAYFTVLDNPPWAKYTKKPIYYMPLPQMFRYKFVISPRKYSHAINKSKRVALLRHSVKSASVENTLNNVLSYFDVPIMYFLPDKKSKLDRRTQMYKHIQVFPSTDRNTYMHALSEAYVAVDDNEGYIGWSRFAMECALLSIPCIGSTRAVKEYFPELYTEPKDYKKQRLLLARLLSDETFYMMVMASGFLRVFRRMNDANAYSKLLKIAFIDLKVASVKGDTKEKLDDKWYCMEYVDFLINNIRRHGIPPRPTKGGSTMDNIHKRIISQKQWDVYYGKWKPIFDNPKMHKRLKDIAKSRKERI